MLTTLGSDPANAYAYTVLLVHIVLLMKVILLIAIQSIIGLVT